MQRSCVFDCVQNIHLSTCVVNIFYGKYPTFYRSNFFSSDSAHVYAIHNRQNVINQGRVPGFIAFTSQEIFLSASRRHAASMRWRNVTIGVRVQLASGLKADTEIPFMMPYCWPQPFGSRLRYHVLGLPVYRYSASWIGKKGARQQHQHLFIYLYLGMALGGMLYGVVAIDLLYPVLSITVPVDIAVFLLNRKALDHN